MTEPDQKDILKQALKEWLDEKMASFGWFSLKTLAIIGLVALTYFILQFYPWHEGVK